MVQRMEVKLNLTELVQDEVLRLLHTFSLLVSPRSEPRLDLETLSRRLVEIQREFRSDRAIEDALDDAEGFVLPPEVAQRDIKAYQAHDSSLVEMIRSSLAVHKQDRFNRERCDASFARDVEYERLSALATTGVVIDTPTDLIRGHPRDNPRRLTKRLHTVYVKAAYEVWRKGQGIILPRSQLTLKDQLMLKDNHPHF